jgi:uncharacterized membrane protein
MAKPDIRRETGEPIVFDALLTPHRSLSPQGFLIFMAAVCGACFAAGLLFVLVGAWPVGAFFVLVVALVYGASRVNYRRGRMHESLALTRRDLTVRRIDHRGEVASWRFQPTWLQVLIDEPPGHHSQLVLRSHGRSLAIGAFLSPEERFDLAGELRRALARAKCAPQPLS